jgi:hypothetical protein
LIKRADWEFGCGYDSGRAAERRFCSATHGAVGLEFTHAFPWSVYDCLVRDGVRPVIETSDQYTGLVDRKRIVRLRASWRKGVSVDIDYEAEADSSDAPEFRGYFGTYKMNVSPRPAPGRLPQ